MLDYARHLAREREHICVMPDDDEALTYQRERDEDRSPFRVILTEKPFWDQLIPAIDALDTEAHLCFMRFHLLGQPADRIAAAFGLTPKRVYRVLDKARRQVARRLVEGNIVLQQHGENP